VSSQLKEQRISIRLSPYVQIEGGNHALVRACADSSAGALGESATLYVYARSDYRCQCDDLSFSSWVGTQKFLVDLFKNFGTNVVVIGEQRDSVLSAPDFE